MGSDLLEENEDSLMNTIASFGARKIVRNLTSSALPSQVLGNLSREFTMPIRIIEGNYLEEVDLVKTSTPWQSRNYNRR